MHIIIIGNNDNVYYFLLLIALVLTIGVLGFLINNWAKILFYDERLVVKKQIITLYQNLDRAKLESKILGYFLQYFCFKVDEKSIIEYIKSRIYANENQIIKVVEREIERFGIICLGLKDGNEGKIDTNRVQNNDYLYGLFLHLNERQMEECGNLLRDNEIIFDGYEYELRQTKKLVDFMRLFDDDFVESLQRQLDNKWRSLESVLQYNKRYASIIYANGNGLSTILKRRQTYGNGGIYWVGKSFETNNVGNIFVHSFYENPQVCNGVCRWTNTSEPLCSQMYAFVATDIDADCRRLHLSNNTHQTLQFAFEIVIEFDNLQNNRVLVGEDNTFLVQIEQGYVIVKVQGTMYNQHNTNVLSNFLGKQSIHFVVEQDVVVCRGVFLISPLSTVSIDCTIVSNINYAILRILNKKIDRNYLDLQQSYNLLLDRSLDIVWNRYHNWKLSDLGKKLMNTNRDLVKATQHNIVCGNDRLFATFDGYGMMTIMNGLYLTNNTGYNYQPEKIIFWQPNESVVKFDYDNTLLRDGVVEILGQEIITHSKVKLSIGVLDWVKVYRVEVDIEKASVGDMHSECSKDVLQNLEIELQFDLSYYFEPHINHSTIRLERVGHKYTQNCIDGKVQLFCENKRILVANCSENFCVKALDHFAPSIKICAKVGMRKKMIVYFWINFDNPDEVESMENQKKEQIKTTPQEILELIVQRYNQTNIIKLSTSNLNFDKQWNDNNYLALSQASYSLQNSKREFLQLWMDAYTLLVFGEQQAHVAIQKLTEMQYPDGSFAYSIEINTDKKAYNPTVNWSTKIPSLLFVLLVVEFIKKKGEQIFAIHLPYLVGKSDKSSEIKRGQKIRQKYWISQAMVESKTHSLLHHCLQALFFAYDIDSAGLIAATQNIYFAENKIDEHALSNCLFVYTVEELLPFVVDIYYKQSLLSMSNALKKNINRRFWNKEWYGSERQNLVLQCIAILSKVATKDKLSISLNTVRRLSPKSEWEESLLAYTLMVTGNVDDGFTRIKKISQTMDNKFACLLYKGFVENILGLEELQQRIKFNPNLPLELDNLTAHIRKGDIPFVVNVQNNAMRKDNANWQMSIDKKGYTKQYLQFSDWLRDRTIELKKVE